MKVATYNVNGVNGRLPRLLEWLHETSPDIVCLQEIKTTDEKCPARTLSAAGYGSIWHGQRSHHGVAILAKGEQPAEVRRGLPGDELDKQARYLEAEVNGLVVASVHLHRHLTPGLAPRLTAAGVDSAHRCREKPSDHAPVWVQL